MIIDGKIIASHILDELTKRVEEVKKKHIIPHLAVILVGDDASSAAYVRQKKIKVELIGAKISVSNYKSNLSEEELLQKVDELNKERDVHGIIIQRPLPEHIDEQKITYATAPQKDVDGFHPQSPFKPPIALAVWKILSEIHNQSADTRKLNEWLNEKHIVILGKGQTAGQPIIEAFQIDHIPHRIIDSKTENKEALLHQADIIISAIGKPHILKSDDIQKGAILIGVGMDRGEDGKMHPDYDEDLIKDKASFYTPVPGGVGPINVAMLLSNLLLATEDQITYNP